MLLHQPSTVLALALIALVTLLHSADASLDAHHLRHHDHHHDENDDSEDGFDGSFEGGEKMPVHHRCIHDEIKMKDIPTTNVSYSVDPSQALVHERAGRKAPNFHDIWAVKKQRLVRDDKGEEGLVDDASDHLFALGDEPQQRKMSPLVATFDNIRIRFFFNVDGNGQCDTVGQNVSTYQGSTATCTDVDILTDAKKSYIIDKLMTDASTYLSNALNVVRVTGNLTVSGARCGATPGVVVPTSHRSPGVDNADFIIYVTAVPQATVTSTVAFASTCFRDQQNRPVVGFINFVPRALGNAVALAASTYALDLRTAIHETSHALGFSAPFFSYGWVDANGVRSMSGGTQSNYDATFGKTLTKVVTPRVLASARAYFNCSTLDGVEIEDQGGSGTASSHWEKRILYQEYIAGVLSSARTYVSPFTLAFFEDMGFYTANYDFAETGMTWGKGKGCSMLTEKCNSASNQALGEYCFDSTTTPYCTADRTAGGYCDVSQYTSAVPVAFRYFSDIRLGAQVLVGDYCPAVLPYSNRVCIEPTNRDTQDMYGNTYHAASRCFISNLVQTDFDPGATQQTRCFPFSCSIVTGAILLNIRGQTARCPSNLQAGLADLSAVSGYKGQIMCPAASSMCPGINAPTPAPTPAPPTPVPTPAPPGYTPAPAPVQQTAKQWYNANMPAACADRVPCAANLSSLFPACRLLAKRLVDCFGTNCINELMSWTAQKGFTAKCASTMEVECQDTVVGADALCTVATGSASTATMTLVVLVLALVVHLLGI